MFDFALVRDLAMVERLMARLNEGQDDDEEPYCDTCGATIGIFHAHGDAWMHYTRRGHRRQPHRAVRRRARAGHRVAPGGCAMSAPERPDRRAGRACASLAEELKTAAAHVGGDGCGEARRAGSHGRTAAERASAMAQQLPQARPARARQRRAELRPSPGATAAPSRAARRRCPVSAELMRVYAAVDYLSQLEGQDRTLVVDMSQDMLYDLIERGEPEADRRVRRAATAT